MDTQRATKRRKLDAAEGRKRTTPATPSKVQRTPVGANSHIESAQDAWAEAKAKRESARKKAQATEVYDDIDGAYSLPPKRTASATRRLPSVDPLRNQREGGLSSHVKQDSIPLDFFKQFHTPKKAHTDGRKKTFEDEIKELEEKARKEAAEEGDDDAPKAASLKRRGSERRRREHDEPVLSGSEEGTPVPAARSVSKRAAASTRAIPKFIPKTRSPNLSDAARNEQQEAAPQFSTRSQSMAFAPGQLTAIQEILLEKLTCRRPIPLTNLGDEYAKVSQLISQTISAGESNSMLLIGARGSGKTTLINQVLREQAAKYPDYFHVVRLNGFAHTDDKIALREIWRQLGREMELEDEENQAKNYADTLTTLLALLSHPADEGRGTTDEVTKSVIFILDEFELFASHPRQTLLYNLFDIAQSRKAPIAVLGLTTRVDVVESLEKRVKSRFSHRYVHLSLAKSFPAFSEACQATLTVDPKLLSSCERAPLENIPESNGRKSDASSTWGKLIEKLWSTSGFESHLRRLYYTTNSVPDFMSSMLVAMATLSSHTNVDLEAIIEHISSNLSMSSLRPPDSKLALLSSLSTLQLALLICAARLTAIHSMELISFALAYEEYKVLASKAKLQASASGALTSGAGARVSSKGVAKNAWADLLEMGLMTEDGRGGGGSRRVDVGLEEIGMSGVDLGQWGRWCKEI